MAKDNKLDGRHFTGIFGRAFLFTTLSSCCCHCIVLSHSNNVLPRKNCFGFYICAEIFPVFMLNHFFSYSTTHCVCCVCQCALQIVDYTTRHSTLENGQNSECGLATQHYIYSFCLILKSKGWLN